MLLPVGTRTRRAIVTGPVEARSIALRAIFSRLVELARAAVGSLRTRGPIAILTARSAILTTARFEGPIPAIFARLERALAAILTRFKRAISAIFAGLVGPLLAELPVLARLKGALTTVLTGFERAISAILAGLKGTLTTVLTRFERAFTAIFTRLIWRTILAWLVRPLLAELLVFEPAGWTRRTIAVFTARRTVATIARLEGALAAIFTRFERTIPSIFTRFEWAISTIAGLERTCFATIFARLERTVAAILAGFIRGATFTAIFARLVGPLLAEWFVAELLVAKLAITKSSSRFWSG